MTVANRRNDDGYAPRLNHLIIVGIAQRGIHTLVVGGDADERFPVAFGILLVDIVEILLKIKRIHFFKVASY